MIRHPPRSPLFPYPTLFRSKHDHARPLPLEADRPVTERRARLALTAVLAVYGGFLILHPGHYGWLDSLDLAIHEFGHPLFGLFGEFIGVLGGTLMQLLMPAIFVGYFWRQGDRPSALGSP